MQINGPWGLNPDRFKDLCIQSWYTTFNAEQCKSIIDIGLSLESQDATVGMEKDKQGVDIQYRKSKVSFIPMDNPDYHWIFQKITDVILNANKRFYDYDLYEIECLQFTRYDEHMSKYEKHLDSDLTGAFHRKLSFSILLSQPTEFSGGDLVVYIGRNPTPMNKVQGIANFFPSFILHEVTPITSGERYALVGWVNGPRFR